MKDLLIKEQQELSKAIDFIINDEFIMFIMNDIVKEVIDTVNDGGRVIFTGIGKNVYACQKLAASFSSIGIPSFFMDAVHAVHGDLGMITTKDILICMSKSGNTSELINTLVHIDNNRWKFAKKIIGIDCGKTDNGFDKYCDMTMHLRVENEIDSLNMVPTVSALLLQLVGDVIGVKASELMGFNDVLFRTNHPGGTIGQTLV